MKIFNLFHSQIKLVGKLNRPAKLLLLALTLDGLLFAAYNLFFNFFILADGHSREFLGLINAMPSIAALVLGLPMGMLSDRIGRKPSMVIGFTFANIGIITMLLVHQPVVMLAMAFVWGAAAQLYVISQAPFMMNRAAICYSVCPSAFFRLQVHLEISLPVCCLVSSTVYSACPSKALLPTRLSCSSV
jgi:MFS family permease